MGRHPNLGIYHECLRDSQTLVLIQRPPVSRSAYTDLSLLSF